MTITIDTLHLAHGGHDNPTAGLCLLEAVAYFAEEDHTDQPQCVSPILTAYGIRLNDRLNDADRQQLKPYIFKMIGTRGDGRDDARRLVLANAIRREILPKWLNRAGITGYAAQLRNLPEIVTLADLAASRDLVDQAYREARSRRSGWYDSIRSAVRKKLADVAAAAAGVGGAVVAADAAAAVAAAADAAAVAAIAAADAVAVAAAAADVGADVAADVAADAAVVAADGAAADAVAVVVAVAGVADAADVAAAVAAADAVAAVVAVAAVADVAAGAYWQIRNQVYETVRARLEPLYAEWRAESVSDAVKLFDRIIAP